MLNRVTYYSAPAYFISNSYQNEGTSYESVRARTLLNKVAGFQNATPQDLNVLIRRAFEVAEHREEDLAEIGSHIYSRMMRKI